MCKYCEDTESLYYNKNSYDVREVYIESDGNLVISMNTYDYDSCKKSQAIGFTFGEACNMAKFHYNMPIDYCPKCGRELKVKEKYDNPFNEYGSTYGGKWINLNTLDVGTVFYVCNGAWEGEIVERDNIKCVHIYYTGEIRPLDYDYWLSININTESNEINEDDIPF